MESGFLICRYHRTSPGLANPGVTMFKNPTSKFQMFKGAGRSEGARGAALAAARLRVTDQIDVASAVFRADEAVARARREDRRRPASLASSTPSLVLPKFRPKLSPQEFLRLSGAESRAALPSSTPPLALPKFQSELSWQRFSAHERRGNSPPAFSRHHQLLAKV